MNTNICIHTNIRMCMIMNTLTETQHILMNTLTTILTTIPMNTLMIMNTPVHPMTMTMITPVNTDRMIMNIPVTRQKTIHTIIKQELSHLILIKETSLFCVNVRLPLRPLGQRRKVIRNGS